MDADEREITHYLATWGVNFVNAKEIARRASTKKRFNQSPDWAAPALLRLEDQGIIESDAYGRFRLKANPHGEEEWVAPDVEKLLREDGDGAEDSKPEATEEEF